MKAKHLSSASTASIPSNYASPIVTRADSRCVRTSLRVPSSHAYSQRARDYTRKPDGAPTERPQFSQQRDDDNTRTAGSPDARLRLIKLSHVNLPPPRRRQARPRPQFGGYSCGASAQEIIASPARLLHVLGRVVQRIVVRAESSGINFHYRCMYQRSWLRAPTPPRLRGDV